MSKLYIKRNTGWLHYSSKMKILIDDKKIFYLKDEELNNADIEPGMHRLEAKVWGYGKVIKEIDVRDGQDLHFKLIEGEGQWKYVFASILILFIIFFVLGSSSLFIIILGLVGLSYFGFVMSRNKNKYLAFQEVVR